MSLGNFISFDDDEEVVAPTPKPKRKRTPPGPPRPPIPVKKVEEVRVKPKEVEKVGIITEVDNTQTKITLTRHFENTKKVSKDTYTTVYKGKKTMLGSLIKPTDKLIEICFVDASNAGSCRFIGINFRYIAERELETVSRRYMSLDNSRRVPALVELKYMNNSLYEKHRLKIVEQFC